MFIDSYACRSRKFCVACRSDRAFQQAKQTPEVCPFGVTLESARAELAALYAQTHPEQHRGISGCCDRADSA